MLRRFVNTACACGVGVVFSSLLSGGAHAADFPTKAAPLPYAETDDFWTRPYLFGDLGRTKLKEQGIELGLTLGDEAVGNVTGGSRNTAANAGQLWFGAKFDLAKLAGIQGGTVGLTLVVLHFPFVPVTGLSVNPARSLGPALFVGGHALAQVWLFIIVPPIAAFVAGLMFKNKILDV